MLNNKKGVSEVVANVLIVLLVIVGIAVIWSVVKPTIDKGAGGIQNAGDCFSVSVSPVSCTKSNGALEIPVTCTGTPSAGGTCTTGSSVSQANCQAGCVWGGTAAVASTNGIPVGSDKVVIRRNSGGGTFENVVAMFSDGSNSGPVNMNIASTGTAGLTELASTNVILLVPSTVGAVHTVTVVPKVGGQLCQVTELPISCN